MRLEQRLELQVLRLPELEFLLIQLQLESVRQGNSTLHRLLRCRSQVQLKLGSAVLIVAVVATAAWGVPILLHRQHETEAIRQLARLARSASSYYVKPRAEETGGRMLCQFPPGEIRTTTAKSCCDSAVNDGHGHCDPARIEWNRSLWNVLHFQMTEAQPYVFEFAAQGKLGEATFTVSAYGDLDCDGQFSTFRFVGKGDARSTPTDCLLGEAPRFEAFSPDE